MIRAWAISLCLAAGALSGPAVAQTPAAPSGEQVFQARCKMCHEPAIERAPGRAELATRNRADVVAALTSGVMKPMAAGLSPAEIEAVAAYVTAPTAPQASTTGANKGGRPTPPPAIADKMCAANGPIAPAPGDWSDVGLDNAARFQRRPGFTAAEAPRLTLKWAYTMAGGGQATVVGDWLFIANRSGKFYALDAKTGCAHWVRERVPSRTTPLVIRLARAPSGWATILGMGARTVRAFDAQTGQDLWTSAALDPNPVAGITGTPVVAGERLIVPLTSGEEGAAIQKTYPCCSFRGSVAALDLATGKTLWRTSMITEPLRQTHRNEAGVMMQGPAGAAIWSAPTVDLKRGLVYVATGDSYTDVDTQGDDAIVAVDLDTGKIRWSSQMTAGDNYVMACEAMFKGPNCPNPRGPDYDFGASPILMKAKGGREVLLAGQKSGAAYGLDPATGRRLWKTQLGVGSALGGIEWGMAADDARLYVPVADAIGLFDEARAGLGLAPLGPPGPVGEAGLYALDPASGKVLWRAPAPKAACAYAGDHSQDYGGGGCIRAQSAPASVMPGLVFSGTLDGWLRAYDSRTGRIVWAYSTTAQPYDTVNGVKGQPGGGIDGMGGGPVIAHGMVYVMSGYNGASRTGGNGNNVLLAFSVDGR